MCTRASPLAMADDGKRTIDLKQYSYKATSNLVIQQQRGRGRRAAGTGSDEVEALRVGALDGAMGDRAVSDRAVPPSDRSNPKRKRSDDDSTKPETKPRISVLDGVSVQRAKIRRRADEGAGPDVVATADELGLNSSELGYIPRTQVSRMAFEGILAFVATKMGDLPRDILRDAAEEILATLKADTMREAEKKKAVEAILGHPMSEDEFARLSTFGRQIKDFGDDAEDEALEDVANAEGETLDEDHGVAVVFDDDDDDADDEDDVRASRHGLGAGDEAEYVDVVVEPEDVDEDAGLSDGSGGAEGTGRDNASDINDAPGMLAVDAERSGGLLDDDEAASLRESLRRGPHSKPDPEALQEDTDAKMSTEYDMFADDKPTTKSTGSSTANTVGRRAKDWLDPSSVDGYWIERQLSRHYKDAQKCQELASKVFDVLSSPGLDRSRENRLVLLLDYDKFDLIKLFLRQRATIVYCVRLSRAKTDEERLTVEREMASDAEGAAILDAVRNRRSQGGSTTLAEATASSRKRPRGSAPVPREAEMDVDNAAESADPIQTHRRGEPRPSLQEEALQLRRIDLDDLVFPQGSRLLSVREVKLPGSEHHVYKDYEEWHIPARKRVDASGEQARVHIDALPQWVQPAFASIKSLNPVQSKVFPCAFESDENMLVCAPTGAGKTNIALLSILRAIGNTFPEGGSAPDLSSVKIVYVAPMKALVAEVVGNLEKRLSSLGVSVRELTGDVNLTRQEVNETTIIVTTPEKWDIITRKAGERTFTNLVRLLIVDEIHLLHDERGPVLESIIGRTVRASELSALSTRIVGLSATLPNFKDVAAFMRVDLKRGLFHFDASYRPCPLQQCYVGVTSKKALKRFQTMNDITYEKVKSQVRNSNQVIVFVHSRKDTASLAKILVEKAIDEEIIDQFIAPGSGSYEIVKSELGTVQNFGLASVLENGVGLHHAGLSRSDRTLVEDLFESGHIKVLVSTATLAWGVNLPAHAVIIRGTQVYSPEKGEWVELSPMDVMQMMGRAGRPQFDTQGEGFIVTTKSEVQFYLSVLNQQLPVESQMVSRLADTLNAEIAIGSITSLQEGAQWLGYTYLHVRMIRNPTLYGVPAEDVKMDDTLQRRRTELVHAACLVLVRAGLVQYDRKSGQLHSTDLGRIASDFYIGHTTMSVYSRHLKRNLSDIDLLRLFALSGEFRHIRVRDEEKLELVRLADRVPVPIRESLEDGAAKVNVLLQAYVSNLKLDGLALASDMVYITQSAARLVRALFQVAVGRGWAPLADRCLRLCKSVSRRQWTSQSPLRQFVPGVSEDLLRRIERKDIDFERYYDLTAAEVGELLSNPKLGKTVHRLVHALPRMDLAVRRVQPVTRSMLRIEVELTPDFRFDKKLHGYGESFWVWVENADCDELLHAEPFYLKSSLARDEQHVLAFVVPMTSPRPPQYFVRCVSDRWIVPDAVVPVSFRHLILPNKFVPHTQLLELRRMPVRDAFAQEEVDDKASDRESELEKETRRALRKAFASRFDEFNAIQTQSFAALMKSEENCVIAGPPGSGQFVCAELAIARAFLSRPTCAVVYISGKGDIVVQRRLEEFKDSLGVALGISVCELSGESPRDVASLRQNGVLAVATPRKWDMFSRRWQRKKEGRAIANVDLVVLDDAQVIGDGASRGAVVEVIGSRIRYVAAQAVADGKKGCRVVAIMDAIANARDIGHWLGAPLSNVLSFHPRDRGIPIDFDIDPVMFRAGGGVAGAAHTLARPVFGTIRKHLVAPSGSVVVFVPSRRLARTLALELVALVAGDKTLRRFVGADPEALEPYLEQVQVQALRDSLAFGVGYLHEALAPTDRAAVEDLHRTKAIQVVVCTAAYSWMSSSVRARLVVIAGTAVEESGGYALSRAEYSLSDLSHMIGRAGRPGQDDRAKCVILTEPSLRQYYRKVCAEPMPVESYLDAVLADELNAEIAARVVQTKQQAVDYLTWSLFYRRLPLNPTFYNMRGNSHRYIQDHLSDMIETALSVLESSKCIAAVGDDDMALGSQNFGMIASHYYVRHASIEVFDSLIGAKSKVHSLLYILASAAEFGEIPVRVGEDEILQRLAERLPLAPPGDAGQPPSFSDPHVKAHLLLQSHLGRVPVVGDLADDRETILRESVRLIRALVDVISSEGWMKPAIAAMELSQLFVQGMWDSDPPVMQLPNIDSELASTLKSQFEVASVDELLDMEDDARLKAFESLTRRQLNEVAIACNKFPDLSDISAVQDHDTVAPGDPVRVRVRLERAEDVEWSEDEADRGSAPTVIAPRFPSAKEEGWWLLVCEPSTNTLLGLKYVTFWDSKDERVDFSAPMTEGDHNLELYLISDSYVADCDKQDEFVLKVVAPAEAMPVE